MKFIEALEEMKKGRRVRLRDWDFGESIYFDEEEDLFRMTKNVVYNLLPSDVMSDEWDLVIIYYKFSKALELMKQGEKMRIDDRRITFDGDYITYDKTYDELTIWKNGTRDVLENIPYNWILFNKWQIVK